MGKLGLYYYTIRDLKPIQIKYQILDGIKKKFARTPNTNIKSTVKTCASYSIEISELDQSEEYLSRFDLKGIEKHEITLLNETHIVDLHKWYVPSTSHLWNYNLQYMEFLIPVAVQYSKTKDEKWYILWKDYLSSWMDTLSLDSFEPYTISMRIVNWLIEIELFDERFWSDTAFTEKLCNNLYLQYRHLIDNQEYRLLANHYFENLKAILIGSMFFDEYKIYTKYLVRFNKQIQEQILTDGFHFERSPMYHRIILEDILRVYSMMIGTGHSEDTNVVSNTIKKMGDAMCSFEKGFDRIPLFNDSGNNVAKPISALKKAAERFQKIALFDGICTFENAGYGKLYGNKFALILDCGDLGPQYMSGHGHCDCLSIELAYMGRPFIVNSGTELYQGDRRRYYRSTVAHSTLMIDNQEQAQVWGEHRAGKKFFGTTIKVAELELRGRFKTYKNDTLERNVIKIGDGIELHDKFKSIDDSEHVARSFLHIAPGFELIRNDDCIELFENESREFIGKIEFDKKLEVVLHKKDDLCIYAEEFGKHEWSSVIELKERFRDETEFMVRVDFDNK